MHITPVYKQMITKKFIKCKLKIENGHICVPKKEYTDQKC